MFRLITKASSAQSRFNQMMQDMSGYKPFTTFYYDFTIADAFDEKAVRDTYKRVMKSWSHDYKYLTELYLVLNHKIWELYESNRILAQVYDELWRDCGKWCDTWLPEDELEYFYRVTD